MLNISAIPAFKDNYIWVIRHTLTPDKPYGHVIVVDPGDAKPVLSWLDAQQLSVSAVLITHNCFDHVLGIEELISHHPAPVYGPAIEQHNDVSHPLEDGSEIFIGNNLSFHAMLLPGHTLGHLAFYTTGHVFVGDVMFGAGCGRIKKGGNAEQMFHSLQKLAALPEDTKLYCAHEYTLANLAFAQTVEPSNLAVKKRMKVVAELRASNKISLPSTIADELATNPFLRCTELEITQSVSHYADKSLSSEVDVFSQLRRWKDYY